MINTRCEQAPRAMASDAYREGKIKSTMAAALAPPIDPTAAAQIIHLVSRLLDINPEKRMTVEEALRDPWMAAFANNADPTEDINENGELNISLDDDTKENVDKYRSTLYDELKKMRKDPQQRLNKFFKFRGSGGSAR